METLITDPAWMEPMLPEEGNRELEDIAFELTSKASSLAGQVNPTVTLSIGNLVRSMNCYYSNLIEGQKAIDEGTDDPSEPLTTTYALWLHREFCRRLPEDMLWVEDPHSHRRV